MNNFYVYEWIRLDTNEPFYVGKGHGNRAYMPFRNPYFNRVVEKVGLPNIAVHILHDNLTEKLSFEYEIYYIYSYVYEFGFNLTNLTIGGDGVTGYKWTEEQCKKLSEARSGKKASEETRRKISEATSGELSHWYGKHSEESRKKISESLSGRKYSEETRRRMSESRTGENNPMWGKKASEETRRRMSESSWLKGKGHLISGANNPMSKDFILIFPDGQQKEFVTITEASLHLGGTGKGNCSTRLGIQSLLKGWKPTRGRWVGYSAMYKEDIEKETA